MYGQSQVLLPGEQDKNVWKWNKIRVGVRQLSTGLGCEHWKRERHLVFYLFFILSCVTHQNVAVIDKISAAEAAGEKREEYEYFWAQYKGDLE